MGHLKQWWYAHSTWIIWAVHFLVPSVNAWMDQHPKSVMGAIFILIASRMIQVNGNGGGKVVQ
jgi:hypothetical protein